MENQLRLRDEMLFKEAEVQHTEIERGREGERGGRRRRETWSQKSTS